jgi:hypothetical protein
MPLTQIQAGMFAGNAITAADLAAGSITTEKIANNAVTSALIANSAITSALIANSAIASAAIASEAVTLPKLARSGLFLTTFASRTSNHTLTGDSGWVDHISTEITVGKQCSLLAIYSSASSFESGAVEGFARLLVNGTMIGYNSCVAKQSTANAAGSGTVFWDVQNLAAGTHTIKVQVRNSKAGTTWTTPYWSVDGQTANTLGLLYYNT